MSTKYSALVVTLEFPLDEDSIAMLVSAIQQLRGVLSVEANESNLLSEAIGATRERTAISNAIWELLEKRLHHKPSIPL